MRNKVIAILMVCLLLTAAACSTGGGSAPTPAATPTPTPTPAAGAESAPTPTPDPAADVDGGTDQDGDQPTDTANDLTGSDQEEAYKAYTKMIKSLSADPADGTQYDADFTMDFLMEFTGALVPPEMARTEMRTGGNMKVAFDGGDAQYYMSMDMSAAGMGVMEVFYDGKTVYCTVNGVEQGGFSVDDVMDMMDNSVNLPDFEEKAIKSVDMKAKGGGVEYSVVIDGAELTEYIMETAGDEVAALGGAMDISDVVMRILVDGNSQPKEMDMIMTMGMSMEELGMGLNMKVDYYVVFNKYGDGVVIDFSKMRG